MMTEGRQRERRKSVEGKKSAESDVYALKLDGEALKGAVDALNSDGNVLKERL